MSQLNIDLNHLRTMIGLHVHYRGVHCVVLEILEDGPAIVLEDREQHTNIQPDQHGEAHRKVPRTYTIHIYNAERIEFSTEFLSLQPILEAIPDFPA